MITEAPTTAKKYTLTLSPNYVLSWNLWDAVRELLQNAIDQKKTNPDSNIIFNYNPDTLTLTVGSTRCRLAARTLLMGEGSKRDDPSQIGEHGEGFKLAMLVLARFSFDIVISNDDVVWTPNIERSEEYGVDVLVVTETEAATPTHGVCFHIGNVTPLMFDEIVEKYLPGFGGNHILDEAHFKGKVFVGGLFVCHIERLEYGYNFNPDRVRLDRDRRLAPVFEIACEAGRLWARHPDRKLVYANMKRRILDTEYMPAVPDETADWICDQYLEEHGDAIPVSSQDEIEKCRGSKIRLVPAPLRNLLRRVHEFVFNRTGTPCERLEAFQHTFGQHWNTEAIREFEVILSQSKDWIGPTNAIEDPL